jgi:hypothetical protein
LGPIIEMESVSINKAAERWVAARGATWSARARASRKRGVKSNQELGVAKLETGGPVRCSHWLSLAWWTGPPPIPRRGPPRATNTMTKPPRRSPHGKLLADSGSEPWVNAGPLFKELAPRMSQHDGWACSRVGWTIPSTHAKTNSLRIEHPIRTLTCRALVTRQSNRDLYLSFDNCLLE